MEIYWSIVYACLSGGVVSGTPLHIETSEIFYSVTSQSRIRYSLIISDIIINYNFPKYKI